MKVLHNKGEGMFYIEQDGEVVAELTYRLQGDGRLLADHTWVDESLEGQGIGKQLLDQAVAFAKEHKFKIVPLCPYVKHQFEKEPAKYADVAA